MAPKRKVKQVAAKIPSSRKRKLNLEEEPASQATLSELERLGLLNPMHVEPPSSQPSSSSAVPKKPRTGGVRIHEGGSPATRSTTVRSSAPPPSVSASIPASVPEPAPSVYFVDTLEAFDPRYHLPGCHKFFQNTYGRHISTGTNIRFESCRALTGFQRVFKRQRWESFLHLKCHTYEFLVRCFYGNMVCNDDPLNPFPIKTYFAQKEIIITQDLLADILQVPNSGCIIGPYTLADYPSYPDDVTPESASAFIHGHEDPSLVSSIVFKDLTFFAQVVAKIISFTIIPKTGGRDTLYGCFKLAVYCIMAVEKINLPHLIGCMMRDYYKKPKKCLPYGKLITLIAQFYEIDLSAFPVKKSDIDFNQRNLKNMGYKEVEVPILPDFELPTCRPPAVTIPFSRRRFVKTPHPASSAPEASASEAGPSSSAPSSAPAGPSFPPPPPPPSSSAGIPGVSLPFPFGFFSVADPTQLVTFQQLQDTTLRILNEQISWNNRRAEETHRWLQMIHPTVSLPPPFIIPLHQLPASSAGTSAPVPPVIPVASQIGCHIDTPATAVHIPDLPVPESGSQREPVPATQSEPVHDTPAEDSGEDDAEGSSFGDAEGASWSDEGSPRAARHDDSSADDPDFVPDPFIQYEITAIGRQAAAEALSHPEARTPSPGVAETAHASQVAPSSAPPAVEPTSADCPPPAVEPTSAVDPPPPTPASIAEDTPVISVQLAASVPSPVDISVEPSASAQPEDPPAVSSPAITSAAAPAPASSLQIIPYPPLRVTPLSAGYIFSPVRVSESSDEDSWSGE